MTSVPIVSHFQTAELLAARAGGMGVCRVSLDLGLSQTDVEISDDGVHLPDATVVAWSSIEQVDQIENVCFEIVDGAPVPIRFYSEETARTYQLMPTQSAPALLISGFVMHRIRDVSPKEGAQKMVQAVAPIRGRVLDTATGLGYAALEAARFATEVVTIEIDQGCQRMIRHNPWSKALLSDLKIKQLIGDSSELIKTFDSESFQRVVHDPPAINVAGELYAEAFYAEAYRVLGRGGRMFHYIGDPKSASGSRVTQGVVKRMQSAGFSRVVPAAAAFGVIGYK